MATTELKELQEKIQQLETQVEKLTSQSKNYEKWYYEEIEKNELNGRFIQNLKESIELFTNKK
ncbi:MAG: hypothetical protein ACK5KP_04480 [Paludibacteraceae bacterium]